MTDFPCRTGNLSEKIAIEPGSSPIMLLLSVTCLPALGRFSRAGREFLTIA